MCHYIAYFGVDSLALFVFIGLINKIKHSSQESSSIVDILFNRQEHGTLVFLIALVIWGLRSLTHFKFETYKRRRVFAK